ncbi:hypothetical protein QN277_019723 [Acacia crassicarpa]|uniref:Uncharacterized protein n=1 Tax=Acacia crassicarpa TaxID=499986 RepID=A0AAE1JI75_9FABA|nr:hypothetical protein QN277_019723 [Acacia crassicarpa]
MRLQLEQIKDQSEKKQEEIFDQIIDLDARLSTTLVTTIAARDNIEKVIRHLDIGSSSTFGFTTAPTTSATIPAAQPSSPSFAFPSPPLSSSSPASTSTPATVVLSSPSTPTTVVLPSSTTPPTELLPFPLPSPDTPTAEPFHLSPSVEPPRFEDDKGGEEEKD